MLPDTPGQNPTGPGPRKASAGLLSRWARVLARHEWWVYVAVALLAALATWFALDLWNMDWNVPLAYNADATLIAAHIKTDGETGWYETQPLLGAPFEQVYFDWKSADNLHHVVASLLGLVIGNFAVVMNLYYLLGFVLAGLAAVWFLRLLRVSQFLAVALAVLYAIAPYHFVRGEEHMWLSMYYPIPLALGVVYWLARGIPLWVKNERFANAVLAWVFSRASFTLVALALVATSNSYYAFWVLLFIAMVGLGRLIYDRRWRRFFGATVAGAWTLVIMIVNMLPDMIYSVVNGANTAAVVREPSATEAYALKLTQLLLPQEGHRVPALGDLRHFYDTAFPLPSESPALGFFAACGFVVALAVVLYATVTWGALRKRQTVSEEARVLGVLSSLAMFGFLLSTVGGFASIIGLLTSDLRGSNRMSIILAILALGITGSVLDVVVRRITRRAKVAWIGSVVSCGLALVVVVVGYLDQVAPVRVPNYAAVRHEFDADRAMVKAVESTVPHGAMIMQLPHHRFPETGSVSGVPDSDQLKPYLHSDTLRWSGGAIKGRPRGEWVGLAERDLSSRELIDAATAAGFAGILLDTQEFGDRADRKLSEFTEVLGSPAYVSSGGRYVFYTTAGVRERLTNDLSESEAAAVGNALVHPVVAAFAPDYGLRGFTFLDTLKPYNPRLVLTNPRSESVEIDVSMDLAYRSGDAMLRFSLPDGRTVNMAVSPESRPFRFTVMAPPGETQIPISVVSGPALTRPIGKDTGPVEVANLHARDVLLHERLDNITKWR